MVDGGANSVVEDAGGRLGAVGAVRPAALEAERVRVRADRGAGGERTACSMPKNETNEISVCVCWCRGVLRIR